MILPLKDIVPMIAPRIPRIATSDPSSVAIFVEFADASDVALSNSTAAIVAAAPPPMPLYMAII